MSLQIDKETKSKARLLHVIRQELTGWEEFAIKVDPPEAYQRPSVDVSVDSVDAVLNAQKEMLRMMAEKGYPADQIKSVISALGEKSTDGNGKSTDDRQTKEDLATLNRRRERDRLYQEKRRQKIAASAISSVDAVQRDLSSLTSLPLEVDTNKESKSSGIRARGCRLPSDFQLTAERRAFAATQIPEDRIQPEFEKFCDYWRAASGRNATKVDWDSTWRNWCRTAAERGGRNVRSGSGVSNSQAGNGSARQNNGKASPITAAIDAHIQRFSRETGTSRDVHEAPPRLLPGGRRE